MNDAHGSDEVEKALVVIPARYGSQRLPGKMLLDRTGKALIAHVVERVQQARRVERVVVATDDQRIEQAVQQFGGEVVRTAADHPNGTSRIAEAVEQIEPKGQGQRMVVNVQGDEPEIEPGVIDALIAGFSEDAEALMGTVASPFSRGEDANDPNTVKVVVDRQGRALYFTRAPVPFDREGEGRIQPLKHVGLYAYRRAFLERYVNLPATPLEQAERLEQLRALEHGYALAVVQTETAHHGIDTQADYDAFVRRHAAGAGE